MSVEPCPHGIIVGRCEFCRTDELAALRAQVAALQEQLAAAVEGKRAAEEQLGNVQSQLGAATLRVSELEAEEERSMLIRLTPKTVR